MTASVRTSATAATAARARGGEPPADAAGLQFTTRHIAVILGLTVLAAALRFFKLGEWGFWIDEAHTFRDATSDLDQFWQAPVGSYPLSYLTLRVLIDVLPATSEGWLRLPFTFFGVLSVPLLALVGRAMVGRRAALLAALLLTVFPWHIYWSQNARAYSMTMFFGLLAAGGFYHGLARRSLWGPFAAIACVVLSGLTHPSGFLLITALIAYGAVEMRRGAWLRARLNRWVVIALVLVWIGLLFVAWPSLDQASRVKGQPSLTHFAATFVYFLNPAVVIAALGGVFFLYGTPQRRDVATFLLCWIGVPSAILTLIGAVMTKVTAQYAFFTLPAFCLATGALLIGVTERLQGAGLRARMVRLALVAIVFFELLSYDFLYYTSQHGDRPRWREASLFVKDQPGDKLVLTTNDRGLDFYMARERFWGAHQGGPEILPILPWDIRDADGPEPYIVDVVERTSAASRTAWVVTTEPELSEKDPTGRLEGWLRRHARQLARFPAWTGPKDMTVLVWQLPRELPPR